MSEIERALGEITEILAKWNQAKEETLDEVFPKVYENLKRLAKKARRDYGRTDPDDTLCTTGLVNELYLQLRNSKSLEFKNRGKFFALCLVAMRRMLRDYYARKISKTKEVRFSPELERKVEDLINLSPIRVSGTSSSYTPLELAILFDDILTKLAEKHPRKVEVIFLKYWLGETDEEIAEHLRTSIATVRRDCNFGEVLIEIEIDNKLKSILNEATDITDIALRGVYLENTCGENKGLLKHLETMLNEHLKHKVH